ncbi:MAG: terminase small subunit [Planctomycetota bacterium]|jgi:phage terminase small subunit
MNDKQVAFCREYVKDWNAKEAAIRAGYSEHTAKQQGHRLLTKVYCRDEIKRLSAEIADQNDVEIREIIAELRSIAFGPEDEKVRNSDRLRALEMLGKYKGMFDPQQGQQQAMMIFAPRCSAREKAAETAGPEDQKEAWGVGEEPQGEEK